MGVSDALTQARYRGGGQGLMPPEYEDTDSV
jgi:hypothetical protein